MTTPSIAQGRLARGPAAAFVLVSFAVLAALAHQLVPWDWFPGGEFTQARATEVFTPAEVRDAEEFAAVRRAWGIAAYGLSILVPLMLGFTPLGARLVRRVTGSLTWVLAVPAAVVLLLGIGRTATLPLSARIHALNREHGLSAQPWPDWGVDQLKSFAVTLVVASIASLLVVALIRRSPRWWFAWAGAAAACLVVLGSFLYPVVIEPVFNRFTPMADGPFKASVFALAEEEGVEIDDVLVSDASRRTNTLNAYVSGLGQTRRVVVYDNLIKELTPVEARAVIAHELAHAKHDDVLLGTALGAVGAGGGVGLLALGADSRMARKRSGVRTLGEPAAIGMLLAVWTVAGVVAVPAQNVVSRAIEARADRVAVTATENLTAFTDMQHELAVHSLADPTPPRLYHAWFGSHPTVLQRVGLARAVLEGVR